MGNQASTESADHSRSFVVDNQESFSFVRETEHDYPARGFQRVSPSKSLDCHADSFVEGYLSCDSSFVDAPAENKDSRLNSVDVLSENQQPSEDFLLAHVDGVEMWLENVSKTRLRTLNEKTLLRLETHLNSVGNFLKDYHHGKTRAGRCLSTEAAFKPENDIIPVGSVNVPRNVGLGIASGNECENQVVSGEPPASGVISAHIVDVVEALDLSNVPVLKRELFAEKCHEGPSLVLTEDENVREMLSNEGRATEVESIEEKVEVKVHVELLSSDTNNSAVMLDLPVEEETNLASEKEFLARVESEPTDIESLEDDVSSNWDCFSDSSSVATLSIDNVLPSLGQHVDLTGVFYIAEKYVFCRMCNINIFNYCRVVDHVSTETHAANRAKHRKDSETTINNPKTLSVAIDQVLGRKLFYVVARFDKDEFTCDVCDVSVLGRFQVLVHVTDESHRRNVVNKVEAVGTREQVDSRNGTAAERNNVTADVHARKSGCIVSVRSDSEVLYEDQSDGEIQEVVESNTVISRSKSTREKQDVGKTNVKVDKKKTEDVLSKSCASAMNGKQHVYNINQLLVAVDQSHLTVQNNNERIRDCPISNGSKTAGSLINPHQVDTWKEKDDPNGTCLLDVNGVHYFTSNYVFCSVCNMNLFSSSKVVLHVMCKTHLANAGCVKRLRDKIPTEMKLQQLWRQIESALGGSLFNRMLGFDDENMFYCDLCDMHVIISSRLNVLDHVCSKKHAKTFADNLGLHASF